MNYNCGGILVDLVIPEKDVWVNQQACIDIIVETGNPDFAHDIVDIGEALFRIGFSSQRMENG